MVEAARPDHTVATAGSFSGRKTGIIKPASPFKWGGARVTAGGGVMNSGRVGALTPPSAQGADTSPFEWGGELSHFTHTPPSLFL